MRFSQQQMTEQFRASQSQISELVQAIVQRPVVVQAGGSATGPSTVISISEPPRSVAEEPEPLRQDFKSLLNYIERNQHLSPTQASPSAIFSLMPILFGSKFPVYKQILETCQQAIKDECDRDSITPGMVELHSLWRQFIRQVDVIRKAQTVKTWHELRMLDNQTPQQFAERIQRMVPSLQGTEPVDPATLIDKFRLGIGAGHPEVQQHLQF